MSRRMPINFVVAARLRGPFSIDDLRRAARALRCRYPGLAARIVRDADGKLTFCDDEAVDFPICERPADADDAWVREAQRQIIEPFDAETGPLCRFSVVRGPDYVDLLAVCDHIAADGLSSVQLLREVCTQIALPETPVEPLPLPPSVLELLPPELLAKKEVRQARRFAPAVLRIVDAYQALKRMLGLRRPSNPDLFPDRPTADTLRQYMNDQPLWCRSWSLDADETQRLIDRCRAERTTVHAAICTAFIRAYVAAEYCGPARKRLVESPLNLRVHFRAGATYGAGLYNALAYSQVDGKAEIDFWNSARDGRKRLEAALSDVKLFSGMAVADDLLSVCSDQKMRELAGDILSQGSRHELSISNLGRVEMPQQIGPLQIEAVRGPLVVGQGTVPVVGVATHAGRMHFCATSLGPGHDESQFARVIDRTMQELQAATAAPIRS